MRVSTPVAILGLVVTGLSLGIWHYLVPVEARDSIAFGATVVGAGTAIYSLYLQVHKVLHPACGPPSLPMLELPQHYS